MAAKWAACPLAGTYVTDMCNGAAQHPPVQHVASVVVLEQCRLTFQVASVSPAVFYRMCGRLATVCMIQSCVSWMWPASPVAGRQRRQGCPLSTGANTWACLTGLST